jgi:amino-acid N-acetyltransferase
VAGIAALLQANVADPSLFRRSVANLKRSINGFRVAVLDGKIVGCACLQFDLPDLAELATVAVDPSLQGQGIGHRLIAESLAFADEAGCRRLWLATLKPDYFVRFGFKPMSQWRLPLLVLLARLPKVFHQPLARWPTALLGRIVCMQRARPFTAPTPALCS